MTLKSMRDETVRQIKTQSGWEYKSTLNKLSLCSSIELITIALTLGKRKSSISKKFQGCLLTMGLTASNWLMTGKEQIFSPITKTGSTR